MKPFIAPLVRWLLSRTRPLFGLTVLLGVFQPLPTRADVIDDLVQAELVSQKIPGAAVVVIRAGEVVKVGAYGLADKQREIPVTPGTIFRLQSVSKSFTAAGILLLVEDGKVALDDPISRHLANTPESWSKITIRHLLNQTSGLRDFINDPVINLREETDETQLLASAASRTLKFEPGLVWDYSNTNYLLLGIIITQVTGQWHGDFLAERIFKPLGMDHTSLPREGEAPNPERARGYTLRDKQVVPSGVLAAAVTSNAGGGIQSTVNDLAKWERALASGKLLKPATLELMWTPAKLTSGATHPYGFGWEIGSLAGRRRISHTGRWTGYSAQVDRFIDDDLTVIILTNLAESSPEKISRGIAATFQPALAAPTYQPIEDREPAVTTRLTDVLRRTREGGLRAEEFVEPVWAYLEPRLDQTKNDFARFGPLQNLTLVERTDTPEGRSYRYRARFRRTSMIFHFVLTADDRIAVMMPEQVNQLARPAN
jgi:D-alanyl-D-alanine carboxypeptidase